MRTFAHFPEQAKCPLCDSNKDSECVLIEIIGTAQDGIAEGQPTHTACLFRDLRFQKQDKFIFARTK